MYKLIIVDDECAIRNGLCNYFPWGDIGFEVVTSFENGKLALDYLNANMVDVVLTDVKMPVMDGIELAKQIFESGLHTKIVFLSGYRDFEYAKSALDFGVRSYLLKPTKYEKIFDAFTKLRLDFDKERSAGRSLEKEDYTVPGAKINIIDCVKAYVSENIKDVTLEGAAVYCRLNPHYLSSLFRQQVGEKFSDYVLKIKMQTAAKLLVETNAKIYEISLRVGYSNANSFSRTFRNYYNISPKSFRGPQAFVRTEEQSK